MTAISEISDISDLVRWGLAHPIGATRTAFGQLTFWALAILAASAVYPKVNEYVDIVVLMAVVSVGGLVLTYVHPRKMDIEIAGRRFRFQGDAMRLGDAMLHQLPFFVAVALHGSRSNTLPSVAAVAIVAAYVASHDVSGIYSLS